MCSKHRDLSGWSATSLEEIHRDLETANRLEGDTVRAAVSLGLEERHNESPGAPGDWYSTRDPFFSDRRAKKEWYMGGTWVIKERKPG